MQTMTITEMLPQTVATSREKVALFGGGFNPVGLHHEEIARIVWKQTELPTWMMPCYQHRFSKNSSLISPDHRFNLIVEASMGCEIIKPFDWEIRNRHNGSMFETMNKLVNEYPNIDFHIVIGIDNANIIEKEWDRGNFLIEQFPFIVLKRKNVEETANWYKSLQHKVIDFENSTSSSDIRNAIMKGNFDFAKSKLHPKVWNYIIEHNLYKN